MSKTTVTKRPKMFQDLREIGRRFEKTVITSSQATMWRPLRLDSVNAEIKGYG